jgi:hypothetical protein
MLVGQGRGQGLLEITEGSDFLFYFLFIGIAVTFSQPVPFTGGADYLREAGQGFLRCASNQLRV